MNFILNMYAWSPAIAAVISLLLIVVYRNYVSSNPKILIITGLGIAIFFALVVFSSTTIGKIAHCESLDEGSVRGCMLLGRDVSEGIQTVFMSGWFGVLIVPIAFVVCFSGVVMVFGWVGLLKSIGLLFVATLITAFIKGFFN